VVKDRPSHVADPVDRVAGAEEVRVQRVGRTVLGDGAARGDQGLGGEDTGDDGGPRAAAEDVHLDPLEIQQIEKGLQFFVYLETVPG
jgi:hypothetical protein